MNDVFHTIVDDPYRLNIIDNFLPPDEADYLEKRMEANMGPNRFPWYHGSIGSDGGSSITAKGVLYSGTNTTPTIGASGVTQISGGTGSATFSVNVPAAGSLTNSSTYYARIYATNSIGTTYSSVYAVQTIRRAHVFKYATGKFGHSLVCNSTNTVTVYAQADMSTNIVLQLQEPIYTSPTPNHSSQPSGLISYSDGNHKGRWTGSAWQSGFTSSC